MQLFPAIDLRGDRLVRLREGKPGEEFSYDLTPVAWAERLVASGASYLHVIDLGAAFGEAASTASLRDVLSSVAVPTQVGGGIRTLDRVRELLDLGATRLIMSTKALQDHTFLCEAVGLAGPAGVVVALDFRGGKVGVQGWQEERDVHLARLGERFRALGLELLLVTAIERDGTFEGPDVGLWRTVAAQTGMRVMGAGGIGDVTHLERIAQERFPALAGVVVGRALVEGHFSLEEALEAFGR
jgi:phosphoribosylformimino-5-aminoimidazole carboxamide ribotide isomerase